MNHCSDIHESLLTLCEEQSVRAGRSLASCLNQALTDWLEAQTGKTILELLGIAEPEEGPPTLAIMGRTA